MHAWKHARPFHKGRGWTQEGLKGRVVGALGPLYFLLGTCLPLISYYRYFLRFSCLLFPYGPCMANNAFLACELLGPLALFGGTSLPLSWCPLGGCSQLFYLLLIPSLPGTV